MTKRALAKNSNFELSDIECRQKGKSYTVKTLNELKKTHPERDFYFILGIDAFLDIPHWWHHEELLRLAHFIIISRPGLEFINLKTSPIVTMKRSILRKLDKGEIGTYTIKLHGHKKVMLLTITPIGISSREIRARVRQARSIKYLLPASVESYIISNKLYI